MTAAVDWGSVAEGALHAFEVGGLRVEPSRFAPAEIAATDTATLRIEVGDAFGSGVHPTTRAVLEYLAERRLDRPVLDIGTGTAILGLAALAFGAPRVVAMDIDPAALAVARRNAVRNGYERRIDVVEELPSGERFGTVVANILASPLEALAPRIAALTDRDAEVVLTGCAIDQADRLVRTYRNRGFRVLAVTEWEGWARLEFGAPW